MNPRITITAKNAMFDYIFVANTTKIFRDSYEAVGNGMGNGMGSGN